MTLRKNIKDIAFFTALCLKISAGYAYAEIYTHYTEGSDYTITLLSVEYIGEFFGENYAQFWLYLADFTNCRNPELTVELGNHNARTVFYYKILSALYALSGSFLVVGVICSCFSFFCFRFFLLKIEKHLPYLFWGFFFAVYFVPSFLFWTSGINKEAFYVSSAAVLSGTVLEVFYERKLSLHSLAWVFPALLLFGMIKFFLLVIFVFGVFCIYVYEFLKKQAPFEKHLARNSFVVFGFVFLLPAFAFFTTDYLYGVENLFFALYRSYWLLSLASKPENLTVQIFPFWQSYADNFPSLFAAAYIYPLFNFSKNFFTLLASFEQTIFLLFAFFFLKGYFKKNEVGEKESALLFGLSVFTLASGVLLAALSPNIGTLFRYKTIYVYFLWGIFFAKNLYAKVCTFFQHAYICDDYKLK